MGGDDFDHRLADKFVTYLHDQHNVNPGTDKIAQARLRMMAEQVKIRLSNETAVHLEEPIVIGAETYLLDLTVTREDFEQLVDDMVSSTIEKARQALAEAGVAVSSLNRLLLVGGSTRIPFITERLVQHFGIEPESWLDPDLSVAMGASVRGAITSGEVFERSVVDICPHSLGIAAVGDEDVESDLDFLDTDNTHPLTFAPLIRRNSRLPANFVRTFYKRHDQQRLALIAVYQGESNNTRQNTFIVEFTVDLQNKHDAKLDVSFAYDLNGTINITVQEAGNLQVRTYTMDLSRPAGDNSVLGGFSEHILGQEEPQDEDNPIVTNYLIEKVIKCLQEEGEAAPTGMRDLLERYKLLLEQNDEDAVDEIEDQLYDWIEGE